MTERDIFIGALQRDDPGQRRAYLDAACGADAGLRARVAGLRAVYDRAGGCLQRPGAPPAPGPEPTGHMPGPETAPAAPGGPGTTAAHHATTDRAGTVIAGKYKLVDEVGEGGMGTVWMARQTEPVKRFVAVKLIKAG